MALIEIALLPPSPLLIPEIGKQNKSLLEKTEKSYKQIAEKLKDIDVIISFSDYGDGLDKELSFNISPELEADLKEFGYLTPLGPFLPSLSIADYLHKGATENLDIKLLSQKSLDYGSGIPLYLLSDGGQRKIKVLPILAAKEQDLRYHYQAGQILAPLLSSRKEKIAVIAAGESSSRLKQNSPAGYSPKGIRFEQKLKEALADDNAFEKILALEGELAQISGEKILKQLSFIMGLREKGQIKVLSYEDALGTGYLSLSIS